jgi:thiol-disulfide isomerase/thioredoxin
MKNIYLLFLSLAIGFAAKAQDTVKRKVVTHNFTLGLKTVVKDSSGKQYTYKEWQVMMNTRRYSLWPNDVNDPQTGFTIFKSDGKPVTRVTTISSTVDDQKSAQVKILSTEEARAQFIASMPKPRESEQFTTGTEIESFATHDIKGNKVKLKDLYGKVVVLNFWFIGCPACMDEIPELNKLVDEYKENPNVVFVAIALDAYYDIKKFLKQTPFNYRIVDDGATIAGMYKIRLYPTSVILDKEGKVAFHTVGFATNSSYWMEKTINDCLK